MAKSARLPAPDGKQAGAPTLCPICGAAATVQAHGRIAPFILELQGDPADAERRTALCCCVTCDLVYFSHRFDEKALDAMYSGYRNGRYLSIRRRWEPWYSRNVNSATEPGSEGAAERVGFLTGIVASYTNINELRNIVDYGGDEGQFFPVGYAGPKYVIEVSGKKLVDGVRAAASLVELPEQPHLVIAAHLLEHLVDPAALVKEVRAAIGEDGLFYVEVPLDRPKVRPWHGESATVAFSTGCQPPMAVGLLQISLPALRGTWVAPYRDLGPSSRASTSTISRRNRCGRCLPREISE